MKKIFISLITITVFFNYGFSQQCSEAIFMQKGTILEYKSFNKKGKENGYSKFETLSVENEENALIATIKATTFDKKKKDKESFTVQHKTRCKNGEFSVDMMRFFDTSKLSEYQESDGIKLDIEGDVLEFPSEMEIGTQLNDGTITIKVNKNDFTLVTIAFNITNRKVLGKETITTPAGTFLANKITFDFDSKFGIIKFRGSGVEYYDKDKVVLKSISYNKKGKLIGTTELTSIKQ